ncbi:cyclic Di-GMP phosphodiesterase RmdA [Kutzneria viridogrisea]|uniref:Diguanylate cyclase/phosphodiesterase with PAS/PAC sensor(S) n=2 Tax=Kutzneria TaxID=43356 RepID=W5W1Z8_9PSEU|nr:bifunctional diguanylate cyclase/phosphodiesterase [Kutzneria albida]AHH94820.1 diguanylate cyclase/phosphodiesterase with PAS/PAC sensor(s) [Kutzneria albida DSM 43870]MBA8927836.1 diguanylate cyclase (GGDEF)-like protein/PAS domain S-box-containing protein [Kutzneria viridogrisea]
MTGAVEDQLRTFAQQWAAAIIDTSYVPMSRREIEDFLYDQAEALWRTLRGDPFGPEPAAAVGAALVGAHFTAPEALGRTLQLLGSWLIRPDGDTDRVLRVLGTLSSGYSEALRERTFDEQEVIKQAMWMATDVAQRRLQESEARFLAVFDSAAMGLSIGDFDANILESNQALQNLLGYTREELGRLTGPDIVHPDDIPDLLMRYDRLYRGEFASFRVRQRLLTKEGEVLWANVTISAIRNAEGVPTYQVAMVEDATELYFANQAMATLGMHDPLTGLPTRTAFMAKLDSLLGKVDHPSRVALCVFGMDGFGAITDGLGPEIGDEVLLKIGTKLKYHAEDNGMLAARLGGDEFALLVPESEGTRTVTPVVDQALRLISEPVTVLGHRLSVHASAGIVERAVGSELPSQLLRDATMALHWAKQGGKAQWELFDEQRCEQDRSDLQLTLTLPIALDNEEFVLQYQPVYTLSGDRLLFVEAQLRWEHPEFGTLRPAEFLPMAERTGVVVRLAEWTLWQVCQQARAWQDRFGERAPVVSLRLPTRQARDPDFLPNVLRVLTETGLHARLLQLEFGSDALSTESDAHADDVEVLAEHGVRFAVDGFDGRDPGFVNSMPLHVLKSGKLIVEPAMGERDPIRATVASNLVSLAHQMDLTVIAENVSTVDDVRWLKEIGADGGQGPALGEPRTAQDFESLI